MAINFPASPSVNDTFTAGSITYKWDGAKWIGLGVTPADRLVEGSNSLEITAGNDLVWTGDNVGIGLSDPDTSLHIKDGSASPMITLENPNNNSGVRATYIRSKFDDGFGGEILCLRPSGGAATDAEISFRVGGLNAANQKMVIKPDGSLGVGLNQPTERLHVDKGAPGGADQVIARFQAESSRRLDIVWEDSGSLLGFDTPSTHSYTFKCGGVEKMRLRTDGTIHVGPNNYTFGIPGVRLTQISDSHFTRDNGNVIAIRRNSSDGSILDFFHDGTKEGSINVSGTTVSLAGGHLSRWTQLPGNAERTEILRGTVLTNLDEMCEWGDENNEQLNRMEVSEIEGDVNVAGVFQSWDDDDDTYTNDFYCAMTGDFVIRIAQGTTVARGDLLMSAGDGTAKPQDDDIVRSKTIAKVTSTTVSATYADGSYCVPCVLMAC